MNSYIQIYKVLVYIESIVAISKVVDFSAEPETLSSSLEIALEATCLFLERLLKHVVVLGTKLIVVFLLELGPLSFRLLLHLLFCKITEFFSHLASFDELPHSSKVLFLHVLRVCWVLGLKEKSE